MWPWSREGGLERPRGFRDCTGFLATRTWGDWRFQAAVQQPSYVELRQPDKCIFIWVQYIWYLIWVAPKINTWSVVDLKVDQDDGLGGFWKSNSPSWAEQGASELVQSLSNYPDPATSLISVVCWLTYHLIVDDLKRLNQSICLFSTDNYWMTWRCQNLKLVTESFIDLQTERV